MTRLNARTMLAPLLVFFLVGVVGCSTSRTLIFEKQKQVWKSHGDGSDATLLAKSGEQPAWIPGTKTHFAYMEQKPNSVMWKLWTAKEDGTNAMALTGFDLHPDYSWSPDGTWIAVSRFGPNGYEIVKVRTDGSGAVPLTNNTFPDQFPAWSPKLDKLAFISGRPNKTDYGST